ERRRQESHFLCCVVFGTGEDAGGEFARQLAGLPLSLAVTARHGRRSVERPENDAGLARAKATIPRPLDDEQIGRKRGKAILPPGRWGEFVAILGGLDLLKSHRPPFLRPSPHRGVDEPPRLIVVAEDGLLHEIDAVPSLGETHLRLLGKLPHLLEELRSLLL